MHLLEKIFSIKNTNHHKVITLLGIKISFKRKIKNQILLNEINRLNSKIENLDLEIANLNCVIQAQTLHKETFGEYKNAFEGRDVVLVCTGPTAKKYKPIEGAIHVGVNGAIYLPQVKLDYLFVQDYTINQPNNNTLNIDAYNYKGNNCKKFFGIIPPNKLEKIKKNIDRIPICYADSDSVKQYILSETYLKNWAYDPSREPIADYCGTPFSAMQFILYTNPKRIYIVGADCSCGYAYDLKRDNFISVRGQKEVWVKHVKPYIDTYHKNIEIISVNPIGLKYLFKDISMEK